MSSASRTSINELVPLLAVQSMPRALEFYRDRLGFRVTQSWEPDGVLAWCRLERDGIALMLQTACEEDGPAGTRGRGATFYFNCSDVAEIHRELLAAGLKLPSPARAFYGIDQVYFTDPDGYQLCVQSTCAEPAE